MRERFRGWYPLDNEERSTLWNEGMIVLDTNVLLDLYRRSPDSRKSLLSSLESVSQRLWLPYQVGLEFHKMRAETRSSVAKTHANIADQVRGETAKILKLIGAQRDYNPAIDDDQSLRNDLRDAAEKLSAAIRAAAKDYDEPEDSVLDQLERLYPESRIGRPFDDRELDEARRTAQLRIDHRIPPGFEDSGKAGDLRYGDYFLWRQILTMAKDREVGVILVSRDNKRDWRQVDKQPLPELFDEFVRETGSLFEMVLPQTFIRETSERGFWTPDDDAGIEKVAEEYERAEVEDAAELAARKNKKRIDAMRRTVDLYFRSKPSPLPAFESFALDPGVSRHLVDSVPSAQWAKLVDGLAALQSSQFDIPDEKSAYEEELTDDEDEPAEDGQSDTPL